MHGLVTTGTPAGAFAQAAGRPVIGTANNNPGGRLLLEMAPETKIGVARDQHLVVHRSMRIVTRCAAFADGFMFENEWPALRGMALTAGVALGK